MNKNGFKSNKLWVGEKKKKKLNEGIKHAPDLYIYETPKIRNKKVQKALNSDIENYIVTETRNKVKDNSNNLFGGI